LTCAPPLHPPRDREFVVMNPPFHDGGAEDRALRLSAMGREGCCGPRGVRGTSPAHPVGVKLCIGDGPRGLITRESEMYRGQAERPLTRGLIAKESVMCRVG
jgi:hypothetical protein